MIFKNEFFFLRHGQTDFNVNYNEKKILSMENIDISINQKGQQQAKDVRSLLDGVSFKTICHSPMKRVKETMELASFGYDMARIEIEELRECSYDTWLQMKTLELTQQQTLGVSDFFLNTLKGINRALEYPGPVLIIAHGGIHWALCFQLKIIGHPWDIDNCQLAHFKPVENGWKTRLISSIC